MIAYRILRQPLPAEVWWPQGIGGTFAEQRMRAAPGRNIPLRVTKAGRNIP